MSVKITEKIESKTIQFAWEEQVLYLQIKHYSSGKRVYLIRDMPEETHTLETQELTSVGVKKFSIPVPVGDLRLEYQSKNIFDVLEKNKTLIDNNIEYLKNIKEIIDYIKKYEEKILQDLALLT